MNLITYYFRDPITMGLTSSTSSSSPAAVLLYMCSYMELCSSPPTVDVLARSSRDTGGEGEVEGEGESEGTGWDWG